jgi:hypothetical protein
MDSSRTATTVRRYVDSSGRPFSRLTLQRKRHKARPGLLLPSQDNRTDPVHSVDGFPVTIGLTPNFRCHRGPPYCSRDKENSWQTTKHQDSHLFPYSST